MKVIMELKDVSKAYKGRAALDQINMTINHGDIYGLIGRNGAGKTTLMRVITSLAFADSGEIEIFGEMMPQGLQKARKRIGGVIESPALFPGSTAVQNLEYYQRLKGVPNKDAVNKMLEIVGLPDTGKKKVKNFSLGMKQRLAIAIALLDSPDFLILDEPTNGLDPMGIVEMRELIKRLSEDHKITILISSHILAELSLTATRYGIIESGKMIKELTHEELLEACQQSLKLSVVDVHHACMVLETILKTINYRVINDSEIYLYDYLGQAEYVNQILVSNGVLLKSIKEEGETLENYFINLVEGVNHVQNGKS